jgi:hypothetical protein
MTVTQKLNRDGRVFTQNEENNFHIREFCRLLTSKKLTFNLQVGVLAADLRSAR